MAPRTLPGLGLSGFWDLGEDNWKDANDVNLRLLSALVQASVISATTALPGSPTDGDIYIIPSGGDAGKIAIRDLGAWVNVTPTEGFLVWVEDTDKYIRYDGAAWGDLTTGGDGSTVPNLAMFFASTFDADELLMRYQTRTAFDLTSFADSVASAATASTGTAVLTILKNGASVGTITFTASAAGVFAGAGATFAVDDILSITAPSSADATLANVSVTLKGV
jgi:hypothetical protein